jgi:NAD-dependent SIR2 family protein deacetylase
VDNIEYLKVPKFTIFLGAGASKADGAPLQNEIINKLKTYVPDESEKAYFRNVRSFLKTVFKETQPTPEEILGVIDLAIQKKETISKYDFYKLLQIRNNFILCMAIVISKVVDNQNVFHEQLITNINKVRNAMMKATFISTNYDILIDNSLSKLNVNTEKEKKYTLDYGIDFTNFDIKGDWKRPSKKSAQLFKLHGSFNWLYCQACNKMTLTQYTKGVLELIYIPSKTKCSLCQGFNSPIIIPPTYLKDMSNLQIANIWNKAEENIKKSEIIVFCGYSFPDADFRIKYILKRAQMHTNSKVKKIIVCNNYEGKLQKTIDEEKQRYRRFFGNCVDYTNDSFQDFSKNPLQYITGTNVYTSRI